MGSSNIAVDFDHEGDCGAAIRVRLKNETGKLLTSSIKQDLKKAGGLT